MAMVDLLAGKTTRAETQVKIAVSTDCIGLISNPKQLEKTWGFMRDFEHFEGVEALAWRAFGRDRLRQTVSILKDIGFRNVGIHGRMGKPSSENGTLVNWFIRLIDSLMETPQSLLTQDFGAKYILFHSPILQEKGFIESVRANKGRFGQGGLTLYAENSSNDLGGVGACLELAQGFCDEGIQVQACRDEFHTFQAWSSDQRIATWFPRMLEGTKKFLDAASSANSFNLRPLIHLPLGIARGDSLPLEEFSNDMLRDWCSIVKKYDVLVVVENQQIGFDTGILLPDRAGLQGRRNRDIFEKLEKAGLFD